MTADWTVVEPSATLLDIATREDGTRLLRTIERHGRISHRSEEAQTATSWERFITAVVLGHGDWSITEHVSVTVDATVDRGVMAEWTRHRVGVAYTVESTRFVNYSKKLGLRFIKPQGMSMAADVDWYKSVSVSAAAYLAMLEAGASPQIARSVLPMALATRLVCTMNLRAWRHFFLQRTTREAHPHMRAVTIGLLQDFQERIPLLYQDIEPCATQRENMQKPR
jgi:thymidylate synthase (FAD)